MTLEYYYINDVYFGDSRWSVQLINILIDISEARYIFIFMGSGVQGRSKVHGRVWNVY